MQLGRSLLGGIIGAAVGIALLIGAYLVFHWDGVWLSIPVAILTGLGVRTMVATRGHASIARGAMTLVLALVAYLAGWWLAAGLAHPRAANKPLRATPAATAKTAEEAPVADEDAELAEPAAPAQAPPAFANDRARGAAPKAVHRDFNPLDFLWLAVAALVAYELGRGTGGGVDRAESMHEVGAADPAMESHTEPAATAPQTMRPPD